jgi:hypothetical protein
MAAIAAASSAVQFMGQAQATNEYNAQAAAAHRDARIAAANKYGDLQRQFNYDAKSTNQEGYKAAMKARAEQGTLVASSGAAGVAGGSITLENLIAMSQQVGAENEARIQAKRDDNKEGFIAKGETVKAEAQQRINSMPFKEGPNPLGLAINFASAAVQGGQSAGWSLPGMNAT